MSEFNLFLSLLSMPCLGLLFCWLFMFDGVLRLRMLAFIRHSSWFYLMTVDLDSPSVDSKYLTERERYRDIVRRGSAYRSGEEL